MAITLMKLRSGLQSSIRHGRTSSDLIKRSFSSSAHSDVAYEAKEASKWEKITYLGIVSCTALAVWNLSKGHPHFDEPPAYPHMHIRNKEFPWGPDGLFEVKEHH
ncbi:cytochrome c oxidase subunit 6a, mitochondrial-like [Silene latifolia]|uniref:cytochrome c oxidase subunit 6a, mitochondrial-like n=1 Tax=Silene latifolia TaxID=37657 RepID=UPI003D788A83